MTLILRSLQMGCGLALIACAALPASAQISTSALWYDFDANTDRDLSTEWNSTLNTGDRPFVFDANTRVGVNYAAPQTNSLGTIYGVGGYLNFQRQATNTTAAVDNATANSYGVSIGGDPSSSDASFEFWIRLDDNNSKQIIWESGGATDGSSFSVSGGNLQWAVKDGAAFDGVSVPISTGEYHHVVAVYDRDGGAGGEDLLTLYVDGVATNGSNTLTNLEDWAGSDPSALGGRVSAVGADGGTFGALSNYGNLDGQIAAFRFYETALTATDVTNSIAVATTPTLYFDNGFASGSDWVNGQNWDGNLVPSNNQNAVINADQSATLNSYSGSVQTLYLGADGTSAFTTDGTTPIDGDGTLVVDGGALNATQIALGRDGNIGTLTINSGTINVVHDANAAISGKQAFTLGMSASDGDPINDRNVFTMNGGVVNISGVNDRVEIGEDQAGGSPRINATFQMNGGSFTVNDNIVLGQTGIANASSVILNVTGGDLTTNSQLNVNAGTAEVNVSGGTFNVGLDLQTMSTSTNTDTYHLSGGTVVIGRNLVDRAGTTDFYLEGATLDLDDAAPSTRQVENLIFSSGTMRFSVNSATTGITPLTVGVDAGAGTFTGTGQVDVELDNVSASVATATTTTWTGGSGVWTTTNSTEWDMDNPIQVIGLGTAYDVIVPSTSTTAMTDLSNITSANPDWTVQLGTTFVANDTLQLVAATEVALTPIKAVLDSTGAAITRGSDVWLTSQVGADAAELVVNSGDLDMQGNDIIIGGDVGSQMTVNGGSVANVGNIIFGNGGTEGGTLLLTGGSLAINGDIVEGQLGSPDPNVNNAQLQIDGGSLSVAGDIGVQRFAVGDTSGSVGEYTSTNTSQNVSASGTTAIGGSGTGTYNFNGAVHNSANLIVGDAASAVGVVNHTGGTMSSDTYITIGDAGTGTYNLINGVLDANTGGLQMANLAGGMGELNVGALDGSTSGTVYVNGGNFEAARYGTGTLNIYSGTVVQESNNLVTGQYVGSVSNVQIGGGSALAEYGGTGSSAFDWNTNSGGATVDILANGVMNVGNNLNLGSDADAGSGLDLDISGGTVNVGVVNSNGDLDYRAGGPRDHIRLDSGVLTVADDILIADGTGQFTINGSGNTLTGGGVLNLATGNQLNLNLDSLGVTAFDIQEEATVAGTIVVDDTAISAAAPNAITTLGTAGAWDSSDTGWDALNPDGGTGFTTGDRVVIVKSADANSTGTPIDATGATLSGTTNWALDTSVPTELALVAQTDLSRGAVHAVLDSDGTTTRASDLLISTSSAGADAAGLTVTASDTLDLGGNTMTVGDAVLMGEGVISNGSTIMTTDGVIQPGATVNGLVSGGSTMGMLTFDSLTLQSGSSLLLDASSTMSLDQIAGSDITLNSGASILMAWGADPSVMLADQFDLLSFTSIFDNGFDLGDGGTGFRSGGTFGDLTLPDLSAFDSSWVWDVSDFTSTGAVRIAVQIPEPSRTMLLVGGLMALMLRRRRSV